MHDGYLFTLGVCGTASAASVAPALLDAMMHALPPVKRVALLGDVLLIGDADDLSRDEMLDQIAGDLPDAEAFLVVTPVVHRGLPPRLQAALRRAGERAGAHGLSDTIAALVCVGGDSADREAAEVAFRRWCDSHDVALGGVLMLPDEPMDELVLREAVRLARETYDNASAGLRSRGITHAR